MNVQFIGCVLLISSVLHAAPWDLSPEKRGEISSQIEERHSERIAECRLYGIDYCIDQASYVVNFSDATCAFCRKENLGLELAESFRAAGFYKIETKGRIEGHCMGTSALFVKHVLVHGLDPAMSCSDLMMAAFPQGQYFEEAHLLSVNQPTNYIESSSGEGCRVWLHPSAMDQFLQIYLGRKPQHYFSICPEKENPREFDGPAICATLRQLPRKILFIAYTHNASNHCIVVSTHPDKLFIFDSNDGLYQFQNLETLSKIGDIVIGGSCLRWMAAFDL